MNGLFSLVYLVLKNKMYIRQYIQPFLFRLNGIFSLNNSRQKISVPGKDELQQLKAKQFRAANLAISWAIINLPTFMNPIQFDALVWFLVSCNGFVLVFYFLSSNWVGFALTKFSIQLSQPKTHY